MILGFIHGYLQKQLSCHIDRFKRLSCRNALLFLVVLNLEHLNIQNRGSNQQEDKWRLLFYLNITVLVFFVCLLAFVFFFFKSFWLWLHYVEIPGPGIETTQQQWWHWILKLLIHPVTPRRKSVFLFFSPILSTAVFFSALKIGA